MLVQYHKYIKFFVFLIIFIGGYSKQSYGEILQEQLPDAIVNTPYSARIDINAGHNVQVYIETDPQDSGLQIKSRNEYGYGIYTLYGTPKINGNIKIHIWGNGFSYSGKKSFDHTYNLHIFTNEDKCHALIIKGNPSYERYEIDVLPEAIFNKPYLINPIELKSGKKWSEKEVKIRGLENTGIYARTFDQYQHIEFYGTPKIVGNVLVSIYAKSNKLIKNINNGNFFTPVINKGFIIPIAPINEKKCIE